MATKAIMEFKKGDVNIHYFRISEDAWTAGSTLYFAAKPLVDNDGADAAAVINKSFGDDKIVNSSHEEYVEGYATYELEFISTDIVGVTFEDGESLKQYLGEFQLVSALGEPESYPADNNFIDVKIYADIKRATA
jgi:hypothetical protein